MEPRNDAGTQASEPKKREWICPRLVVQAQVESVTAGRVS